MRARGDTYQVEHAIWFRFFDLPGMQCGCTMITQQAQRYAAVSSIFISRCSRCKTHFRIAWASLQVRGKSKSKGCAS